MRMRWSIGTVTLLCMAIMLSVTAYAVDKSVEVRMRTEQRVALVIGNSAYESRPLKNPVNDAKAIAAALKRCGFQVIQKTDCDRQEFRKAVREFGNKIKTGGVGLFYYSGHGIQVKGTNYLVPVGADVRAEDEVEDECIKMSAVLRKMESAGNRVNIVILDACRNNPFARSFGASSRGLARMDAPKGTFIAYATAPGSIASDGTGKNGVYTSALLNHIVEPGVVIESVFKAVRVDVIEDTSDNQVPWESSSLTGDFYFVLPDGDSPIIPPTAPRISPSEEETPENVVIPKTKIGKDDAEMVLIPAGEFRMGSNYGNRDPVHTVHVDAFYMDKYEVTNAQYSKFLNTTEHKAPKYWGDSLINTPDHPVVRVSWYDAVAYAKWADKRLPTEAEWEKAARGGLAGKDYPWGDVITSDSANYDPYRQHPGKDRWEATAPVGSFAPNGYELYDMAGNVYEWCSNWYEPYSSSRQNNPTGPDSGRFRVLRGGSFADVKVNLRVAKRRVSSPIYSNAFSGFRCAASVSD